MQIFDMKLSEYTSGSFLVESRNSNDMVAQILANLGMFFEETYTDISDLRANPDIFYLSISSFETKTIPIDAIKSLLSKVSYKPFKYRSKIVWIDGMESVGVEGQNSLLKSLEEPDKSTIFVLSTNNSNEVLATIHSRCQKVYLKDTTHSVELDLVDSSKKLQDIWNTGSNQDLLAYIDGILAEKDAQTKRLLAEKYLESIISILSRSDFGADSEKYSKFEEIFHLQRALDSNVSLRIILLNTIFLL